MTASDWITILGVIVTLVSMAISINQAKSAFKSSNAAQAAMTAVQLAAIAERVKSAQGHIRDVAPDKVLQRGFKIGDRLDLIRREFDNALSALPKIGLGSEARRQLTSAQSQLNCYQESLATKPDVEQWQKIQIHVQDAISDLTTGSSTLRNGNE